MDHHYYFEIIIHFSDIIISSLIIIKIGIYNYIYREYHYTIINYHVGYNVVPPRYKLVYKPH